jgi:dTDP-4-amino-4,6-dideoxygalactose transaminase
MNEYSSPTHFIDLNAQQKIIRTKIDKAIQKVLDHGQYIMGPEVKELEADLKNFTKTKHAITCANGTDALTLVLMAWSIGKNDAVFVPSFTYIASAEAPSQLGAVPFFVDVNEDTFNMDPASFKQAILDCRKLGLRPAAVIPVELFGQPANISEITEIAKSENIKILVDGAQSFGAEIQGKKVGSHGDVTTTSFFPAKPLGCYGDGGAVFTNNDELASKIDSIRLHGKGSQKYDNVRIGVNSRLDTIQAAILLEKLKIFPNELKLRDAIANKYSDLLIDKCSIPLLEKGNSSSWAQYTLKLDNREFVQEQLRNYGIPTVIYYPIPLHRQIGYSSYPCVSSGVNTSDILSKKVLSLPMYPYLKTASNIANKLIEILDSK